ncbi:MAG: hypothetical protein ABJ092_13165 [Gillisia sp.]
MSLKVTLNEFLALSREKQFDAIFSIGDYLETRPQENSQVILYAVDRFFVELYFDSKINKINQINAFDSGIVLDKYSNNLENNI